MKPENAALLSKLHPNALSYADAGVDIDAGNALVEAIAPIVKSTARAGSNPDIGGFGGLFDIRAAGFSDPVLVAANDGVGTKLRIAIETGIDGTVGIDLVAMCVNDLVVQGAQPLFFLDYFATGALDVASATRIIAGIAEGCIEAGCALIGGETAEMPGMYKSGDYDLAGFAVGAVERGDILPSRDIKAGDKILGLGSSGVHSNGFSLVRKIVDIQRLDWQMPAPFEPERTLGEVFLTPTRIYVKPLLDAIAHTGGIRALAHITGGGLIENIPRVLPQHLAAVIDLAAINVPPVFKWLSESGGVNETEMLRTFNCGIGMVAMVSAEQCQAVTHSLGASGETVTLIGEVTERVEEAVVFQNHLNL